MNDKLFNFILKCQKNCNKPDLHSFNINITDGTAFVECRKSEVYINYFVSNKRLQWCGTAVAAANKLDALGADVSTIDM